MESLRIPYYNMVYADTQIIELTVVDPAFSKNSVDFQKRFKQVYASGKRLNTNSRYGKKFERVILVSDEEITSRSYDSIKNIVSKAREEGRINKSEENYILSCYAFLKDRKQGGINVSDAQAMRSLSSYRSVLDMMGLWTDNLEKSFERITNSDWSMEDFDTVFQTLKPFVYSVIEKASGDGSSIPVPVQHKNSELVLLAMYDMINGGLKNSEKLKGINKFLEESKDADGNPIGDMIQFESAGKSGNQGVININYSHKKVMDAVKNGSIQIVGNNNIIDTEVFLDSKKFAKNTRENSADNFDEIKSQLTEMLKNGKMSDLSTRDVSRLLTMVNNSVGKSPKFVDRYADQLMVLLLDNIVSEERDKMTKLAKVKDRTVNQSGVQKQGKLDVLGQATMKAFRENMTSDVKSIDSRLQDLSERLYDRDKAVRDEAFAEREGIMLALQYKENIAEKEEELKDLKSDLRNARKEDGMSQKAFEEYKKSLSQAIMDNQKEQVEKLREFTAKLAEVISGSTEKAAAFRAADKQRVEDIHHDANSDMQGTKARIFLRDTLIQRFNNSDLVRFFFQPLATFDQMLRVFGRKNVRGEGHLFNRFMRDGWEKSAERKYEGLKEAIGILDKKAAGVYGDGMRWTDIYKESRKKGMEIEVFDAGEMVPVRLTQGNMAYIYMANKMVDGKMKLRKMGIEEEDVQAIAQNLDPKLKALADWLQEEFYVERRNKYNEVHERMFGAPMEQEEQPRP